MLRTKWILMMLLALLAALQYRLWFGKHSILDYEKRKSELEEQRAQNANLAQRNALIDADINDLKIGLEAIEERACNELGLIREGETFYRILPNED